MSKLRSKKMQKSHSKKMQNVHYKKKPNIGFVRKVKNGLLEIGKKYKHALVKDKHYNCKLHHINRKFIRDYLHTYKWDRELQKFENADVRIKRFSYFNYTKTPTVQQLQWLAGFTEHFSSVKVQYTFKNGRYYPIIRLFYIGSCLPLIFYIAHWYNARVIQYASGHWGICLTSESAIALFTSILPYCVLRKVHYAHLINFYFTYKSDTALFTEFNSFSNFTDNTPTVHFEGFNHLPTPALCNYIGGFYDAKGNVAFQYGKPYFTTTKSRAYAKMHFLKMQLHMFCQNEHFIHALSTEMLNLCNIPMRIQYVARDNCYGLHNTTFTDIMQFLPFIIKHCMYKRAYAELLYDWLPVFYNSKYTNKKYYYIAESIKMYWLFLQYGIELHSENALF